MKEGLLNKKGQFYFFSAIVVIAVIIGFSAISENSKQKTSVKIYDLGEELGIESSQVLDFGIYNEFDDTEMQVLLENFSNLYANFIGEGKKIQFIIGNEKGIYKYSYTEVLTSQIGLIYDGTESNLLLTDNELEQEEIIPHENKIKTEINDKEYVFDLEEGENFYFVITQEVEDEEYIVRG